MRIYTEFLYKYWNVAARALVIFCLLGLIILVGERAKGTYAITVIVPTTEADFIHQKVLDGLDALYRGQFAEARKIFTALTQGSPDDPRGYFFLALTYRWLTRIDPGSTTYQELFEKSADKAIRVGKSLLKQKKNIAEATLYLAASYGYRAEYYNFLKHNWKKAYDDGMKMREYLEKSKKSPDVTIDIELGYALYNYYAYLYQDKIGWWRFLLSLPKGDRLKGINMLKNLRHEGIYTKIEAWYFLIEIYKDDKEYREKAIELIEELHQTYPYNSFFHTLLAGVYHKFHDWENSRRVARDIVVQAAEHPYYSDYLVFQAKYLIGESSFFLGQYEEALLMFDEIIAVQPSHPTYLIPWSHLRRGTIYNLTDRQDKAKEELKLVLTMKDVHHVHDQAKGLLNNLNKK